MTPRGEEAGMNSSNHSRPAEADVHRPAASSPAALSAESREALSQVGKELYDRGHFRAAAQIHLFLVLKHPERLEAWYLLGRSLEEEGRTDDAIKAFTLGARRASTAVLSTLATRLRRRQDVRDARDRAQRASANLDYAAEEGDAHVY